MCHAGYIHKHTQNCPYHHPFVFTCFLEDDFVSFVEDFKTLDFSKYRKLHYNSSKVYDHRDVYSWDALNKLLNIQTENTPVIEFENGVQISYPHIQYPPPFGRLDAGLAEHVQELAAKLGWHALEIGAHGIERRLAGAHHSIADILLLLKRIAFRRGQAEICAEVSHFFFLPEFFPLLVCHHDASPFINHGSKKQGTPLQPMDKFMDKGCSKECLEGSVSAWRLFR